MISRNRLLLPRAGSHFLSEFSSFLSGRRGEMAVLPVRRENGLGAPPAGVRGGHQRRGDQVSAIVLRVILPAFHSRRSGQLAAPVGSRPRYENFSSLCSSNPCSVLYNSGELEYLFCVGIRSFDLVTNIDLKLHGLFADITLSEQLEAWVNILHSRRFFEDPVSGLLF